MPNLAAGTYPAFIKGYLSFVEADTVSEALAKYPAVILDFFKSIPLDKVSYRYAEGKWNIKEMLQHIIDAERIFTYRALESQGMIKHLFQASTKMIMQQQLMQMQETGRIYCGNLKP